MYFNILLSLLSASLSFGASPKCESLFKGNKTISVNENLLDHSGSFAQLFIEKPWLIGLRNELRNFKWVYYVQDPVEGLPSEVQVAIRIYSGRRYVKNELTGEEVRFAVNFLEFNRGKSIVRADFTWMNRKSEREWIQLIENERAHWVLTLLDSYGLLTRTTYLDKHYVLPPAHAKDPKFTYALHIQNLPETANTVEYLRALIKIMMEDPFR